MYHLIVGTLKVVHGRPNASTYMQLIVGTLKVVHGHPNASTYMQLIIGTQGVTTPEKIWGKKIEHNLYLS